MTPVSVNLYQLATNNTNFRNVGRWDTQMTLYMVYTMLVEHKGQLLYKGLIVHH